jgi:uncharacterized membrane protein
VGVKPTPNRGNDANDRERTFIDLNQDGFVALALSGAVADTGWRQSQWESHMKVLAATFSILMILVIPAAQAYNYGHHHQQGYYSHGHYHYYHHHYHGASHAQ